MSEFAAELEHMSRQDIKKRMRTDGEFLGKVIGVYAVQHPELFEEATGPIYTVEEVAAELGIDYDPRTRQYTPES